jgi:hypothetical protein
MMMTIDETSVTSSNYLNEVDFAGMDSGDEREPLVEKLRIRQSRMAVLQSISQSSPRSLHRYREIISRMITLSPFHRDDKTKLAYAFLKWSHTLSLHDKCDELGKQLQERTSVLTTLKESYVRDVIR